MPKHIKTATTEIGVQSEFEIIWYVFQKIKLSIEWKTYSCYGICNMRSNIWDMIEIFKWNIA